MGEVTAAIFRDGELIDRPALDASMPQYRESAFTWIEALDPLDSDFAVLQEMVEHEALSMEQHLLDSFLSRGEITRLF